MKIQADKKSHFLYSMFGATFIGAIFSIWNSNHINSILLGALVMLAIGILKEVIWDKLMKKGAFEYGDLIADLLGCVTGAAIMMVLNLTL